MQNKMDEARQILLKVADSVSKNSKYYETHIQVKTVPGVREALQLIAGVHNIDFDTLNLAFDLGVFLTLRYQENIKLKEIYGDIR